MKLSVLTLFTYLASGALFATPSFAEEADIKPETLERIEAFYATPVDDEARSLIMMSRRIPKYDARGNEIQPKKLMKGTYRGDNPLVQRAGVKTTDAYQRYVCKTFLKKYFPELNCDNPEAVQQGRASYFKNDDINTLVATYLTRDQVKRKVTELKTSAKTSVEPWSDDYWRLQWGATAYRYADFEGKDEDEQLKSYDAFLATYTQPKQWLDLVKGHLEEIAKLAKWSPAEKYDLTVGDVSFGLTTQQRTSPAAYRGANGNVEDWMGICHGWAPAAPKVPRPSRSVKVKGPQGIDVPWWPHDVRAMASLAWANGTVKTNFVGGRCNSKKPATFKNGRLQQQECFDTNPATFHMAMGNLIGELGESVIMDADFDYEVWNQPIKSYKFTYFNPLNPKVRTTNLKDPNEAKKVIVAYNAAFKAKDRFQARAGSPLTRGDYDARTRTYDDSKVRFVVGVVANIEYTAENDPISGPKAAEDKVETEEYTYDLELDEKLVITGGEWHNNTHPDFLWIAKKGATAVHANDEVETNYDGAPNEAVLYAANGVNRRSRRNVGASKDGYPLCDVLKYLVDRSSGTNTYHCEL